jgi:hypothetical protein
MNKGFGASSFVHFGELHAHEHVHNKIHFFAKILHMTSHKQMRIRDVIFVN